MKIFWSWQSDTPGKIGRYFVRDALAAAIGELKQEVDLDESDRGSIHLDQDRMGVAGSPDLANVILDKIKNSTVFVADVTLVGKTADGKPLINANVAIELGYALATVGDAGLLMVFNAAYGEREGLPFDLRQKAGPILFSLPEGAESADRNAEMAKLVGTLKVAIRDCLATKTNQAAALVEHDAIPTVATSAQYFEDGEVLTKRPSPGEDFELNYPSGAPLLYLRLIPTSTTKKLKRREIKDIVFNINIEPLRPVPGNASWDLNKCGGITYSFLHTDLDSKLLSSSQIFFNREIWGVDASLLAGPKTIPVAYMEHMFELGLNHYVDIADKRLGLNPPVAVEAGAARVDGFHIVLGNRSTEIIGPIYDSEIRSRHLLKSFRSDAVQAVLMAIYADFFDAAGKDRPEDFRRFGGTQS